MGRGILIDADGTKHQGISKYPFIIVTASTDKIKEIVTHARESGIHYVDYPDTMFKTSNDNELSEVLDKQGGVKITYRAVLLADKSSLINNLTGRLPLYKE